MMHKRAQLESLLSAPFSALAAALTAPEGDRKRAAGLGALLGAGMAAMAQKEVEAKRARGEEASMGDMIPLFNVIMAGLATGGGFRAFREQQRTGQISSRTAIIAGAPAGALIASGNPVLGGLVGSVAAPWLARMAGRTEDPSPAAQKARTALLTARMRLFLARRAVLQRQGMPGP